jgi:hypothetical protein
MQLCDALPSVSVTTWQTPSALRVARFAATGPCFENRKPTARQLLGSAAVTIR